MTIKFQISNCGLMLFISLLLELKETFFCLIFMLYYNIFYICEKHFYICEKQFYICEKHFYICEKHFLFL